MNPRVAMNDLSVFKTDLFGHLSTPPCSTLCIDVDGYHFAVSEAPVYNNTKRYGCQVRLCNNFLDRKRKRRKKEKQPFG